jgi:hypothetical protein
LSSRPCSPITCLLNIPPVLTTTSTQDIVLTPFRIATSPALLRAYLRTALALLASIALFGVAVVAYLTFYYTYIPVRAIQVPVFLQFEPSHLGLSGHEPAIGRASSSSPFGVAGISGLAERQKYDVEVELVLPRSERNLAAGNWMVSLEMRGPGVVGAGSTVKGLMGWDEEWEFDDFSWGGESGREREKVSSGAAKEGAAKPKPVVLARSRRPAILTYRSWLTECAYRVLWLPLYVLGFGKEAETVRVKMMEGVRFEAGMGNVPTSLRLEIRSAGPLEVYRVSVRLDARLEGLRWIMYRHWVVSAVVLVGLFWGVEMCVVAVTWAGLTMLFGESGHEDGEGEEDVIKKEEDEQHSGLTTPKREPISPPLTPLSESPHSTRASRVKRERSNPWLEDIPAKGHKADDEDENSEDADFILEEPVPSSAVQALTDAGIGTGLERSGMGLVRRRSGGRDGSERDDA